MEAWMCAHLAVVLPQSLGGFQTWTDTARLHGIVAQLLGQAQEAVDLTVSTSGCEEVLGRKELTGALWLPPGAMPTEACRQVVLGQHGVGVWTGALRGSFGLLGRAYSFGPLALEAYTHCVASGCRPWGAGAARTARHLVQRHGVPLVGPGAGLVPWHDGEQRASLLLGGKDVALRRLSGLLTGVRVDPGLTVTWRGWTADPKSVLGMIADRYPLDAVIVRSCADAEDGWERSGAGAYASVPVPAPAKAGAVMRAVDKVFASYDGRGPTARVLVQRWLHPVQAAGVVTTRTLAGAPYYTATVDLVSGRTDTVTSGSAQGAHTWYVRRLQAPPTARMGLRRADRLPSAVAQLLAAAVETESCVGTSRLDVEVALAEGAAHLLQARPLAAAGKVDDDAIGRVVHDARLQVGRLMRARSRELGGARMVLSNMADWNPAEMLGRRPSALALSLYRSLITDRTWAVQRAASGYRDLRGTRLMHVVAGSPYIDATASLESFLPAGMDEPLAHAARAAMAERLAADPTAHDKIEFEVAATCWTPDVAARTAFFAESGIGSGARKQLADVLLALTRHAIARLPADLQNLDRIGSPTTADARPESLDMTLVRARIAAERFAHLARAAFVAVDLLRALDADGLVPRKAAWLRGLGTVTAAVQQDAAAVVTGGLSWEAFVDRYRWIRPGTYDLVVPTYGDDPDGYLGPTLTLGETPDVRAATATPWTARTVGAVTRAVAPLGLDAVELEAFCRRAIAGREQGKAVYASWVSAALEAVAARGTREGIDRSDMRHLHIHDVLSSRPGRWAATITRRRSRAATCALVELPDVITGPGELDCFVRGRGRTNFVGSARGSGPVHTAPTSACPPPPGSVIVLETADPGYDWIFAHRPAALVTAYGGANSHMAIRCAELGIPAAIGTGTTLHSACAAARHLTVDAGTGRLDVLP
jgi:phosphohistidine swiveling domain-containing protein